MKRMVPDFDYRQEDDDEIENIENPNHLQVVMQSIRSVEDAWQEMAIKQEELNKNRNLEEETEADEIQEVITKMQEMPGRCITRSGRISHPPARLIEMAYVVI
jgi:hypothetical protein